MAIKKIGTIDITPSNSGMFRNALLMLDSLKSDVPKNKSNFIPIIREMLVVGLRLEKENIKQKKFINTLKGGTNVTSNRK